MISCPEKFLIQNQKIGVVLKGPNNTKPDPKSVHLPHRVDQAQKGVKLEHPLGQDACQSKASKNGMVPEGPNVTKLDPKSVHLPQRVEKGQKEACYFQAKKSFIEKITAFYYIDIPLLFIIK